MNIYGQLMECFTPEYRVTIRNSRAVIGANGIGDGTAIIDPPKINMNLDDGALAKMIDSIGHFHGNVATFDVDFRYASNNKNPVVCGSPLDHTWFWNHSMFDELAGMPFSVDNSISLRKLSKIARRVAMKHEFTPEEVSAIAGKCSGEFSNAVCEGESLRYLDATNALFDVVIPDEIGDLRADNVTDAVKEQVIVANERLIDLWSCLDKEVLGRELYRKIAVNAYRRMAPIDTVAYHYRDLLDDRVWYNIYDKRYTPVIAATEVNANGNS